jgi:hypothetical protein
LLLGFFRSDLSGKQISGVRKGIGKEAITGQLACRDKISACRIDHDGRTTGIHFNAAHIREISHGRLMNKAVSASPPVFWQRMGDYGNVLKVGHAVGPAATKGI